MATIAAALVTLLGAGAPNGAPEYGSPLAPYPWKRDGPFGAGVAEVLAALEENAAASPGFSARVAWTASSERKLDPARDRYGPLSLKSCPNWRSPKEAGFWPGGTYEIQAIGPDFRIDKPADAASAEDWWQKRGEHIYSRAFSQDWVTCWRFHHDALEADMIGYAEGLGLLLWAFAPGEYIRRADYLDVELRDSGRQALLVATPAWIRTPPYLQNRKYYPFESTTFESWATLRPVVRYRIDLTRNMVFAAEFVYYKVTRDNPKDWRPGAQPSGLVVSCRALTVARNSSGTWYPRRIVAQVREGETLVREVSLEVSLGDPPAALPPPPLPPDKRHLYPWPPYRPEVFREFARLEGPDHANRLGLARALAYEGDMESAVPALFEVVSKLEEDSTLSRETFGGIDWELGFAVYECLGRFDEDRVAAFWNEVPRTSTWSAILARAVDLYRQYRPKQVEKIATLMDVYGETFEKRRLAQIEKEMWEDYLFCLGVDLDWAKRAGDEAQAALLKKLREEVSAKIAELGRSSP